MVGLALGLALGLGPELGVRLWVGRDVWCPIIDPDRPPGGAQDDSWVVG